MPTQSEKAEQFRALHHRDGAFIIPNPWDIGTAHLLARLDLGEKGSEQIFRGKFREGYGRRRGRALL